MLAGKFACGAYVIHQLKLNSHDHDNRDNHENQNDHHNEDQCDSDENHQISTTRSNRNSRRSSVSASGSHSNIDSTSNSRSNSNDDQGNRCSKLVLRSNTPWASGPSGWPGVHHARRPKADIAA